jgi:hypothetical protein
MSNAKIVIINEGFGNPETLGRSDGRIEATVAFATTAEVGTGEADQYVREYGDRAVSAFAPEDLRAGQTVLVDGDGCIVE